MTLRIVALDLSLSCTGVADETGAHTIRPKSTGMERLAFVRSQVIDAVHVDKDVQATWGCGGVECMNHVELVVIEGYSMGTARQNSHAHGLGELGGVVRLALWEAGIRYVDIPPATLKKYATGKGNAGKAEVLTAAVKRLGYDGHDDNEADALWLLQMARDQYGDPAAVKMPADHRAALAGVPWPELAVTA